MATIPDYQTLMLPLLRFLGDGRERSFGEAVEAIAIEFHLTPDDRQRLLPSGASTVIGSRVGWARTYMKKAVLVESTKRGFVRATERGLDVLKRNPVRIDVNFLEQFPEFVEFRAIRRGETAAPALDVETTPEEGLEEVYQRLRVSVESELLQRVKTASPAFFERLVVDLLVKMGYGGGFRDAGETVGKSGDDGIDGIINEDPLGLDVIYLQAKRWGDVGVGRPEIQKFVGALQGKRARKGVFITTSNFTKDAKEYVGRIDSKIVLIDGETLARLMFDYKVGVSSVRSYDLLKADPDYFTEE